MWQSPSHGKLRGELCPEVSLWAFLQGFQGRDSRLRYWQLERYWSSHYPSPQHLHRARWQGQALLCVPAN